MPSIQSVNIEAILSVGRTPEWQKQTSFTGAPSSAISGIWLDNTVVTLVTVDLRETLAKRTARVTMATLDTGATYTVTIAGSACQKATPTDEDDLLTGLRDAINAGVSATVTAVALDASGVDVSISSAAAKSVLIRGVAEADYAIAISATGTGALACVADAASASVRLFGTIRGSAKDASTTAPSGWRMINGASGITVDYRGWLERFQAPGLDRLYVELYDIAGHGSDGGTVTYAPTVHVGPAVDAA